MADVTFTVDGKTLTSPAGTLLIEACKSVGIEIPAFCYYPGLSLQAACRMCVVRIEKMPKLQTACTTPVAEGMVVFTDTPEIKQARKATLQLLLGNHPLDCPVCDAGGECELQDMTFKYGAAESFYAEPKNHREEQKWSPVVYFDRPRCILCYRCIRMCGEGMDVYALGIQNRGSSSVIAPNIPASESPDQLAHLDCEECGMCIDACPVGALTSGTYRYKTRPWEMNHVATICTHCGDGCKTTLGVRTVGDGTEIIRGDNRDKSGINGDFLCNKGRYAFDFANHEGRLTQPLIRDANGTLQPATWEAALDLVGHRFRELRDARGGEAIGVIGSNRITNEEAYLLQKFGRSVLGTNNIDHHRTADYTTFTRALAGQKNKAASLRDASTAPAILIIGGDPTEQHPALAWALRTNVRLNNARIYIANENEIKLTRQAKKFAKVSAFGYTALASYLGGDDTTAVSASADPQSLTALRDALREEPNLLIILSPELQGETLQAFIKLGLTHTDVKFALLGDYVNSRGASDMGLLPDLLPGYTPVVQAGAFATEYGSALPSTPGKNMLEIFDAAAHGQISALYIVGANPVARYGVDPVSLKSAFVVVQDMFLTETAAIADVVLPAANLYEKTGSVTNTYGDLQQVKKAADRAGVRTDFELIVRIADKMGADIRKLVPFGGSTRGDMGQTRGAQSGEADRHAVWLAANNLEPRLSPFDTHAVMDEIQRLVPGYNFLRLQLLSGNDQHLQPADGSGLVQIDTARNGLVLPANDTLFTSGTLGNYSEMLHTLNEKYRNKPSEIAAD
ncbi:MAG TPA: molybdopterin-dependent oxidoreductase [Acidobacteriaceae bacterium]